jgi:hypothetical protein
MVPAPKPNTSNKPAIVRFIFVSSSATCGFY